MGPTEELSHHGIKGQKWGVRRNRQGLGSVGPASTPRPRDSEDTKRAKKSGETARTHGTNSLSNKDLQHLVNRMNLEQQYSRLSGSSSGKSSIESGHDKAKKILSYADTASKVYNTINSPAAKALKTAIKAAKA